MSHSSIYCLVADQNELVNDSLQVFSQVFPLNPTNFLAQGLSFWEELFSHLLSKQRLLYTTPRFRTIAMSVWWIRNKVHTSVSLFIHVNSPGTKFHVPVSKAALFTSTKPNAIEHFHMVAMLYFTF